MRSILRGSALLALLAGLAVPVSPATAGTCESGPSPVCPKDIAYGGPDLFGSVRGWACGGTFLSDGQEGSQYWFYGPIVGGTYVHSDVDTRRMTVRCSMWSGPTEGSGTLRGQVTANSVAPLNFMVSASRLELSYYRHNLTESMYLCTTVTWVDKLGVGHTHKYDADPNTSGAQCLDFHIVDI